MSEKLERVPIDYDHMLVRLEGAKVIASATSGFSNARRETLELVAFMEIFEGIRLSKQQVQEILREKAKEYGEYY